MSFSRGYSQINQIIIPDILLISMRKFNIKKIAPTRQLRAYTDPQDQIESLHQSYHSSHPSRKFDTLQSFHDSLLKKNEALTSLKQHRASLVKSRDHTEQVQQETTESLRKMSDDMKYLKEEMQRKNIYASQQRQHKLDRFIENLKQHVNKSNHSPLQLPPVQPIYLPYPMNYSTAPNSHPDNQSGRRRFSSSIRDSDGFGQTRNKYQSRFTRAERVKRNMKRWRKVANSVLFTIYLKRYCGYMRTHRQLVFQKLKRSLKQNLKTVKQDIFKLLSPFFNILVNKRDVSFEIQEDENKQIRNEKTMAIRKLILAILQAIKKWTIFAKDNRKFTETIYHLCRHGNYSCLEPILTEEELQISCISETFQYVSAQKNLEIGAYINLIYIKILIYNILLCPTKFSSNLSGDCLTDNLELISSTLYEFVIDIQDSYLIKVPKSYKIGNYKKTKSVEKAEPLIYGNVNRVEGQLISGLKGEEYVKKYFKFQNWRQERSMVVSTLNIFHEMVSGYHHRLSKKYYSPESMTARS